MENKQVIYFALQPPVKIRKISTSRFQDGSSFDDTSHLHKRFAALGIAANRI